MYFYASVLICLILSFPLCDVFMNHEITYYCAVYIFISEHILVFYRFILDNCKDFPPV